MRLFASIYPSFC